MLVPYLYPLKSWEPNANHQLYKYNDTQTGILEEMTYLEAYVDLWKDFPWRLSSGVEVSTGNTCLIREFMPVLCVRVIGLSGRTEP